MATQTITASTNVNSIAAGAWRGNDTLVINNGAVVTVDTTQNKGWNTVTINNGKLRIENTSTTTPITFRMTRGSGTTSPTITTASGLGSVEIAGNWIEIGTGNGLAGQTFTLPYRDHVAGIWVETAAGSGIYERWVNCLLTIRSGFGLDGAFLEGFAGFGAGFKGMVFRQGINPSPVFHTVQLNCTTSTASRNVTVTSTAGIFPGAQIVGSAGIAANSVVERVIDGTTLEMNTLGTANSSTVTVTVYNTFECWTTDQIVVGNGTHGKVVPVGAKVRVPNIMVTGSCGINIATSNSGLAFNLSNGGSLIADKCLFANSHTSFSSPQTLSLQHCAFSFGPSITKSYGTVINDFSISISPQYPYLTSNRFIDGYVNITTATGSLFNWNYVTGSFTGITIAVPSIAASAAVTTAAGVLGFAYADGIEVGNVTVLAPRDMTGGNTNSNCAIALQYVYRSNFSNIRAGGCVPFHFYASSENTWDGVEFSLFCRGDYVTRNIVSAAVSFFGVNPNTGDLLSDGVPYYLKQRRKPTVLSEALDPVIEGTEVSITPFYSSNPGFFNEVGFYPGNNQVVISWDDRRPTHNAPAFEIYRSTTAGVPVRDAGTRIYTTNTNTTVTYTDSTAVNGTRYYYVLRKYYSAGVYEDTPVWDVTPSAPKTTTNYLTQSRNYPDASWTKSNVTVPTNSDIPGLIQSGWYRGVGTRRIQVTGANGTLTKTVSGLSIGQTYTAWVFARFAGSCSNGVTAVTSTPMRITFGTAFTDFNAVEAWGRYSVTFTATATSHNFILQFNTSGNWIDLDNSGVNLGATPDIPTESGTAVTSTMWDLSSVRAYNYGYAHDKNCGGYVGLPTISFGLGSALTSIHLSDMRGFSTTLDNEVIGVGADSPIFRMSVTSSNNIIRNAIQIGKGAPATRIFDLGSSSSDNLFENISLDRGFSGYQTNTPFGVGVYLTTDSNRNIFKNIEILNNPPNQNQTRPFFTANDVNGTFVQNFRVKPANTYIEALNNGMIFKGCGGGNGQSLDGAATWDIGNNNDGVPNTFTGIYDTHFGEFYHTETTGALNIFFTASTAASPPYTLTGTASFSNTGLLYLQSPGDSITYTWPHKIYGVSGFRNIAHKAHQNDLAYNNTSGLGREMLQALLVEYQIDTGSGYGAWTEATPANLSAEVVSPTAGFNLKLRLTARQFFIYSGQTNEFVVGERIKQLTSLAEADVTAVYDVGTTGICCIDNITGTWAANTAYDIVRASDNQARCTDIVLVNGFALGPSFNSYIRGLQIHTTVDQTAVYPADMIDLTITGMPVGSDVVILEAGTSNIITSVDQAAGTSWTYSYPTAGTNVDICIYKPGFIITPIRNYALGPADASLPVSPRIDLNYAA